MKDKPTVDYKELPKATYSKAEAEKAKALVAKYVNKTSGNYTEKAKAKTDSPNSASVNQKTKRGGADIKTILIKDVADMKTTLIKWTIIILIAACVFYFVYPKYYFRLPTNGLWRANEITGTVEKYSKGKWSAR